MLTLTIPITKMVDTTKAINKGTKTITMMDNITIRMLLGSRAMAKVVTMDAQDVAATIQKTIQRPSAILL